MNKHTESYDYDRTMRALEIATYSIKGSNTLALSPKLFWETYGENSRLAGVPPKSDAWRIEFNKLASNVRMAVATQCINPCTTHIDNCFLADKALAAFVMPTAQPMSEAAPDEQTVFEDWLVRHRPSGDANSVQSQWERSRDYKDYWEDAFEAGWRAAASWANRDDLIADIGSSAYKEELRSLK